MRPTEELLENIGETTEYARHYVEKQFDYVRLEVAERTAKVTSTLVTVIAITFFVLLVIIMLSLTLGFYLGDVFESYSLGFLAVTGIYFVIALVIFALRRSIITNPILSMIIKAMLD
ncbi:MAG: phage holin family protein [Saprospiraceae bacterium]